MKRQNTQSDFDAIVIGSGMGGLTFASLMAQLKNWRVLVLERHFKAGGFTHTFCRPGGYEWDVGLHYVGQMEAGSMGSNIMNLVTGGEVKWNPMPETYDRFVTSGFQFDFVRGRQNLRNALVDAFPPEAAAIDQYLEDVDRAAKWVQRFAMAASLPKPIGMAIRSANLRFGRLGRMTTGEYLAAQFQDKRLKAVLAAQWGNYGLPPSQSAFATHALIASHYLDGGWYPEGGSGVIAESAGRQIESASGEIRLGQDVQQILISNGRAVGVEVEHKGKREQIYAPVVVSNAGAWATFTKLAPGVVNDLDWDGSGFAVATLYLGLKRDPKELGFGGENHWIAESLDHDANAAASEHLSEGKASACYLSFPSMKDPHAKAHTGEIIAQMPYSVVAKFRNEPWRRRSGEYQALKLQVTEALLALVEKYNPGFRNLVAYAELSSPITSELFTGHAGGSIYGYPATPERFRKNFIGARTDLPGLYLAGTDAMSHGIMGATMGGAVAAALQMGVAGFPKIVAAASRKRKEPLNDRPYAAAGNGHDGGLIRT